MWRRGFVVPPAYTVHPIVDAPGGTVPVRVCGSVCLRRGQLAGHADLTVWEVIDGLLVAQPVPVLPLQQHLYMKAIQNRSSFAFCKFLVC